MTSLAFQVISSTTCPADLSQHVIINLINARVAQNMDHGIEQGEILCNIPGCSGKKIISKLLI
jgi:hypothetical protein